VNYELSSYVIDVPRYWEMWRTPKWDKNWCTGSWSLISKLVHILGEVGTFYILLFRVYPSKCVPIYIEIGW